MRKAKNKNKIQRLSPLRAANITLDDFDNLTRKMGLMKESEQTLQEWFAQYLLGIGVLFCASCGGMRTGMRTAAKMKRSGYRKGFPDIGIFEPRGGHHGLFIEVKFGNNTPTQEQKEWQAELNKRGYFAVIMPKLDFNEGCKFLVKTTQDYLTGTESANKMPFKGN